MYTTHVEIAHSRLYEAHYIHKQKRNYAQNAKFLTVFGKRDLLGQNVPRFLKWLRFPKGMKCLRVCGILKD